jgi:exonuclease I
MYWLQEKCMILYLYWHITLSYIYLVFILTYYTIIHLSGIYIDILQYHTFIWYLYWHITVSYIFLAQKWQKQASFLAFHKCCQGCLLRGPHYISTSFILVCALRILYIYLVFILTYYTIIHLSGIYIDILHYHTFIWYLYWHITLSYIYLVFIPDTCMIV